ncbi:hypothetical protein B0H11DRAFT_87922 [Mycena galericulata]|nr:hypothetical protein B0H11DRAFT_87922 [Mycena galericulata]
MDAPPRLVPDHLLGTLNSVSEAPSPIVEPELVVNGVSKPLEDPTTPISNAVASEPKIDIDLPEQESDARHEPLPHPTASPEPAVHASNGVNGTNGDVAMADLDVHSPATTPGGVPPASSNGASTSHASPTDPPPTDHDDDQPPPAKRARILSDADKASFTHVSLVFLCAPWRAC